MWFNFFHDKFLYLSIFFFRFILSVDHCAMLVNVWKSDDEFNLYGIIGGELNWFDTCLGYILDTWRMMYFYKISLLSFFFWIYLFCLYHYFFNKIVSLKDDFLNK